MGIQFQIETIFELKARSKVFVLAKQMNSNLSWELTDESSLSGIQIEKCFDIPRAHDENGNQRENYYAFTLKNINDKDKLKIGEIAELIP